MLLESNVTADVSLLGQTLNLEAHLSVDLPSNPLVLMDCLNDPECRLLDHADVVDSSARVWVN